MYKNVFITAFHNKFMFTFKITVLKRTFLKRYFIFLKIIAWDMLVKYFALEVFQPKGRMFSAG